MKPISSRLANYITVLTFGVMATLLYLRLPLYSDDLGYCDTFASYQGFGTGIWPLKKLIPAFGHHFLYVNGRFQNYLAMLLLPMPRAAMAILIGALDALMLYALLRIVGIWRKERTVTAMMILTGICFFAFNWWDVTIIVCNIGYVWGTAFALLFYILFSSGKEYHGIGKIAVYLFSLLAGGMHEAIGAPLLAALILYYLCHRKDIKLGRQQRNMLIWFGVGVMMVLTSPGAWMRANALGAADDPLPMLLLKSEPITLLMILLYAVLIILPATRRRAVTILRSETGIWVVAAILSTAFVAIGGKVGRTGWFAQTAALIAIAEWIKGCKIRINRTAGGVLSTAIYGAMLIFGTAVGISCYRAATPDLEMRREMVQNRDKAVFYADLSRYGDQPWWTLGRVRVMNCYDEYSRSMLKDFCKLDSLPKILPTEARNLDLDSCDEITLSNGDRIASTLPEGEKSCDDIDWYDHDRTQIETSTGRYYAVKFYTEKGNARYHLVKWIPEPGDR